MHSKKILVLAGGSVKGAYQAGVVKALFDLGFEPNAIYGVSAGGMNASYLVDCFGKQKLENEDINYQSAAENLVNFWLENITEPASLARRRGTYELGLSAIRRNFEGLLDTTPLKEIVENNISIQRLRASPIALKIGAVDIINGGIVYADPSFEHFHDYIMASSAIPIIMPVVKIGNHQKMAFLDGGLRDVAPIKKAIEDGATEIVCVACHTRKMEGGNFAYGNLLALVDRIMDIAVNESLNMDLDWAVLHTKFGPNEIALDLPKHKVKLTIIRPEVPLNIDIQSFDTDDISRIIELGYQRGHEYTIKKNAEKK
ncbi:MAG: patatin-like phospholipase family protein [Bacteroidota bacterium]